jgi:hypothetical protein
MAHHHRYRVRRQTGRRSFYIFIDGKGKRHVIWDQSTFQDIKDVEDILEATGGFLVGPYWPTSPPCHVCGKPDNVICYPDDHSKAICPDCCGKSEDGHDFEYERTERGKVCTRCGIPRNSVDDD